MRHLLWVAALSLLARPALAQNAPQLVPCAIISPAAVIAVPPPFNAYMRLACWNSSGQGLMPPDGTHWVDGHINVGLTSMDDRPGANGRPRLSRGWYVSLTSRNISPANDAMLRQVLAQAVQPLFIDGANIAELDAITSVGELKQEFMIFPADPVATHGIKLLMECHQFCQGSDRPWIVGMVPDSAPDSAN